jgi:hypothetical protein
MADPVRVPAWVVSADALLLDVVPIQNREFGFLASESRAQMLGDERTGDLGVTSATALEILVLVVVKGDERVALGVAFVSQTLIIPAGVLDAEALFTHRVVVQDRVHAVWATLPLA